MAVADGLMALARGEVHGQRGDFGCGRVTYWLMTGREECGGLNTKWKRRMGR